MSGSRILLLVIGLNVLNVLCDPDLKGGLLYPRESPTRERKSLDGVWDFKICSYYSGQLTGFTEKWYNQSLKQTGDVMPMPVPSSYNEITQNTTIRDYIGWAWYQTEFYAPSRWQTEDNQRVVLYFGAAHYTAIVWLNGVIVANHVIGHLPFQADVTSELVYGSVNRLTVAINSTLTVNTVPQGFIKYYTDTTRYPPGFFEANYNFDFSNYAGIDRSVYLYTTPKTYIDDITITTHFTGTDGNVHYRIGYKSDESETPTCLIEILDKDGKSVVQGNSFENDILIPNVNLWWPVYMSDNPGYLYTMVVTLNSPTGSDVYYQKFGVRTVGWTNKTFTINGKPFYFRGFGKHEDYPIRGKGFDHPSLVKDFNLIKWVGANSFRTSHYPYADEIMDAADEHGIVVIDESSACTLNTFGPQLLENHKQAMAELVRRDKNHPSVVMWSIGNEPDSSAVSADDYFRNITAYSRTLDTTRPYTVVLSASFVSDKAAKYVDIICVNRYYSWYSDTGHLELITMQMETEYASWFNLYNKPVMTTEYGADSVAGLHTVLIWFQ
ncbi:hypothetical protein CHUAL_008425 [Chamberlinius hualienensis]